MLQRSAACASELIFGLGAVLRERSEVGVLIIEHLADVGAAGSVRYTRLLCFSGAHVILLHRFGPRWDMFSSFSALPSSHCKMPDFPVIASSVGDPKKMCLENTKSVWSYSKSPTKW